MLIKLQIEDLGNSIKVQGTDNVLFPNNATLTFPKNSVIIETDESDIATFRSAANYDVLFSGKIKYINIDGQGVTKENIIERFDAIANQESGGGGGGDIDPTNYYTKSETNALLEDKADVDDTYTKTQVDDAIDNAIENIDLSDYYTKAQTDALIPDVSNYFDGAEYDTQTKHINFLHGQTVKAYIDATAFIKDGMVDSVAISAGNLVITFNTDAGKEPITIPLTDIFNPANYYDKTTADSTFATQVVVNQEIAARIAAINGVNDALLTKADKSDTYTKTQVDSAISTAVENIDLTDYATKAELSTVATTGDYNDLSNKPTIPTVPTNVSAFNNDAGYLTQHQSLAEYYTKTQVDTALAGKVSQTEFDTKEEVISNALNDLESDKQDVLISGTNIKTINNESILGSGNITISGGGTFTQEQADWNQSDSSAVDFIKNKPTIPDTSNFLTIDQWNKKELAIANALTELNEEKADVSELNGKQDVLTAGQNITIQNNVISATGGTQLQSDWEESDTTDPSYIQNKPDLTVYVESSDLATVATTGDYDDLTNKPTIPSLTDYYTKTESDGKYATKADFDEKEEVIATSLNGLNTAISGKANTADLATVATSGSYNDLSNKPTIPDVSTKVTNGGNVATIMKITQNDYDALVQGGTVDNNTLYIIV